MLSRSPDSEKESTDSSSIRVEAMKSHALADQIKVETMGKPDSRKSSISRGFQETSDMFPRTNGLEADEVAADLRSLKEAEEAAKAEKAAKKAVEEQAKLEALKVYFGYDSYKPGQEDISEERDRHGKRRKKQKRPFFLNPQDGDKFEYNDLYLISEIKGELNRITSADNVKCIFGTDIFRLLTKLGYVEERMIDGRSVKTQTETGLSNGITTIEKISKKGNTYTVLLYPPAVQKEIVDYYTEVRDQVEADNK